MGSIEKTKISILQWNIWYQEDIKNIAKYLKQLKPDIVCLQELTIGHPVQNGQNTPKYISTELGYNLHYQEIPTSDENIKLANGIFTKFEIKNKKSGWINEQVGERSFDNEHRAYVESMLDINGQELIIGTTHMSYTKAFQVTPGKLEETDRLIDFIKNNKHSFVLTGDFNAQPESEVIQKITQQMKNAGPDYLKKSWTTKPFSHDDFEATTLDWRLDYIFASPDLSVESSEILKTHYSDHLPILAVVEL